MTIKNALQEQLLKAGLADEKQLQSAHKKNKSKKTGKPKQRDDLAAAYRARSRVEKQEQQEKARQAALKNANQKKIQQLIKSNTLNDENADFDYQFTAGTTIKKIYVTAEQKKGLTDGRLGITFLKGRRCLIPADVANEIRQLDPEKIVVLNTAGNYVITDVQFTDFVVPYDLVW